jgi:hypothetical protein
MWSALGKGAFLNVAVHTQLRLARWPSLRRLGYPSRTAGTPSAMAENEDRVVEVADEMAPGDEARPGTPGTGEDACPKCEGSGEVDGEKCSNCDGTGRIVAGVSGA